MVVSETQCKAKRYFTYLPSLFSLHIALMLFVISRQGLLMMDVHNLESLIYVRTYYPRGFVLDAHELPLRDVLDLFLLHLDVSRVAH